MDLEARQAALVALNRAKHAQTESGRLLAEARRETMRAPGSRAAVMAQNAYKSRLSAEEGRYRAAFSLLAAQEGDKLESARELASRVKDAQKRRVYVDAAGHAERRRDIFMMAANSVSATMKNLPGLPADLRPPSAQQVTVGQTEAFRSPEWVSRFTNFFPSDIRSAAGSLKGVDDAVATCEACMNRDLQKLREGCAEKVMRLSSGDPMLEAALLRGLQGAALSGLGEDTGTAVSLPSSRPTSNLKLVLGLGAAGLALYFLTRS